MGKKSLAEKIAELSKPSTEFDIEDNDLRNDIFEHEDDEHLDSEISDDELLKKQHYVDVEKSNIRKANDKLSLGKKYGGNVTSRDDLYLSNEDENFSEQIDSDNESESRESLEEHSDSEDEKNITEQSSDDEDVYDSEITNDQTGKEDSSLAHKRSKLKELMANERKHIINRLSQSASNDAIKGFAILQQHKLFDSILDSRIKVQKSLTNSNVLPIERESLENFASKTTYKYVSQAQHACFSLLDSVITLRLHLMKKDMNLESDSKISFPKKRTLSEYFEVSKQHDDALDKYRSSVLTKWSSKIHNAAGSTAISAGKFKSINQSAEQQVMNNLSDMDRLVKRTKLNRRQIKPLGYENQPVNNTVAANSVGDVNQDIPNESILKVSSNLTEINSIFDDEDFYRVLLNDLVDKKIQSSDPVSGLSISLRSVQQAQKLKKNVDTKASKGRKLRYHIQEQIANFETPRGGWKWDDNQIDEFFASLLGQKVNMNEVDDENDHNSDEDQDYVVNTNDSFKLFG